MKRTVLEQAQARIETLKDVRRDYDSMHQELCQLVMPRWWRAEENENRGKAVTGKILDPCATYALRTLQSGMQAGITSAARPWHRLATFDPELKEYAPVKEHLHEREKIQREAFQASNTYNFLHGVYGQIGLLGTFGGVYVFDEKFTLRGDTYLPGSYWLATDEHGRVDTIARRADQTVDQLIRRFKGACSRKVKDLYDKGNYDESIEVFHLIEPRRTEERGIAAEQGDVKGAMPFKSTWWESGAGKLDGVLRNSGYEQNPIIAPRWDVVGNDPYGYGPGETTRPDVKQLQSQTRRLNEAVEKQIRPPMGGPSSARGSGASLLPGAVTWFDDPSQQGLKPLIDVRMDIEHLENAINNKKHDIREGFYADLWLMLTNSTRREITAREIEERHEEKLIALGPVLERLQQELLEPLITRADFILTKAGKMPPPPPELEETTLKIEYVSILAQAQKAVATGSVERLAGYTISGLGVFPEARHKFDFEQSIDEMGEMLGVPPKIVRSDDEVAKLKEADRQAQAQAQQLAASQQAADTAKSGAGAAKELAEATQGGTAQELLSRLGLSTP